jgi:hypothetical protein
MLALLLVLLCMNIVDSTIIDPRSSNGKTLDFGSGYRSSNLRRGAGPSGEMADTSDSKSGAARREGSNPFLGTK